MIKKLFVILLSALLLLCLGACGENETHVQAVFDTENIVRITFYAYGGSGTGSDVPSGEMEEYIAWLGSFHAGKMIPDQLPPPGTNTVQVEIAYAEGTVVKHGLDTTVIHDVVYYLDGDPAPESFNEILSRASPPVVG
jgi:hypothetical protein